MIPDVDSAQLSKNRRIVDTLEDTLVLLRVFSSTSFERNCLGDAAEQLRSVSNNALYRLLQDPKVHMWTLVDLTPLANRENSEEALALAEELSEKIKLIALGIAHLERRTFRISSKYLNGHISIPGTGISLASDNGMQAVDIASEIDGTFTINGSRVTEKRWQSFSGFTLPVGDPLLEPPRLEGYELMAFDSEQAIQWGEFLTRVEPLLKASARVYSLVSLFGNFILPLKPSPNGNHLSVSFKHRPGIVYASWSQDDSEVLEAIVHESDHQCLYEIINEDSLFTDHAVNLRSSFRSPWRKDPRPLSGLFFGFSAFVTVGVFWEELLSKNFLRSDDVGHRAVLALEQSLDAISITNRHAILTGKGNDLLEFNRTEAQMALERLQTHPHFHLWQSASREKRFQDADIWKQMHRGAELAV